MIFCSDCPYKGREHFLGCYLDPEEFAREDRHYWEAQTGEEVPEESVANMEYRGYIRTKKCEVGTAVFMGSEW